jgi:hypothetical protein
MSIDRTIALARSRDGRVAHEFGCRIRIDGEHAMIGSYDLDPRTMADAACRAWRRWTSILPDERCSQTVTEVGLVRDEGHTQTYSLAQANGSILSEEPAQVLPRRTDTLAWPVGLPDAPLVLGPSATLALSDFILDGIAGPLDGDTWPFAARLRVEDTPHSPYPPQHRDGPAVRVGPATLAADEQDPAFMLLQRTERWQRPVGALYNIARRNLAIGWDGDTARQPGTMIVIDTLTAETEPTLATSRWLGTWYLDAHDGRRWGQGRLALMIDTSRVLRTGAVAIGPPRPACICDPIEGEIYGFAPLVAISHTNVSIRPVSP